MLIDYIPQAIIPVSAGVGHALMQTTRWPTQPIWSVRFTIGLILPPPVSSSDRTRISFLCSTTDITFEFIADHD
jgi:hypothetical protein